jgi:hypothetical protein
MIGSPGIQDARGTGRPTADPRQRAEERDLIGPSPQRRRAGGAAMTRVNLVTATRAELVEA